MKIQIVTAFHRVIIKTEISILTIKNTHSIQAAVHRQILTRPWLKLSKLSFLTRSGLNPYQNYPSWSALPDLDLKIIKWKRLNSRDDILAWLQLYNTGSIVTILPHQLVSMRLWNCFICYQGNHNTGWTIVIPYLLQDNIISRYRSFN